MSGVSDAMPKAEGVASRSAKTAEQISLPTEATEPAVVGPKLQPLLIFLGAFGFASYLVATDTFQPWSPSFVVAVYGLLLYLNKTRLPLTGEVKDSAYYLGFSLNLVFLFVAFRRYGPQLAADQGAVLYLVQALGSAITATIVGLIVRYGLYALDDEEMIQKQVFSELQDEIRKSVSGFRQNQRALAQTITSFVATRRKLAGQEEEASQEYLRSVAQLLSTLRTLQESHVKAITDSVKGMEPAAALSLRQLRTLNEELIKLRQELAASDLARSFGDVRTALEGVGSSAQSVSGHLGALGDGAEKTTKKLSDMATDAPRVKEDLQAIDTILGDFIEILRQRISSYEAQS